MVRGLIRAVVILVIVVVAGAFLLGYRMRTAGHTVTIGREAPAVGTSGAFDADKARERAGRIGEQAAATANEAAQALDDSALTAKIKAKMTLDDYVKARDINVDTENGIVTLNGRVHSLDERNRALKLASETVGVKGVKDNLAVRER